MSRSIFGWSYPPGCSGPPDPADFPCAVCGLFDDACICPECKECGMNGDPACYEKHGMVRTEAQVASLAAQEAKWAEQNRIEAEDAP